MSNFLGCFKYIAVLLLKVRASLLECPYYIASIYIELFSFIDTVLEECMIVSLYLLQNVWCGMPIDSQRDSHILKKWRVFVIIYFIYSFTYVCFRDVQLDTYLKINYTTHCTGQFYDIVSMHTIILRYDK